MRLPSSRSGRQGMGVLLTLSALSLTVCLPVKHQISSMVAAFVVPREYSTPSFFRKAMALEVQAQSQDYSSNNEEMNFPDTAEASSGVPCPFVKYFPRYRIDLSQRPKLRKSSSWLPLPSFAGLSQMREKARISQLLEPDEGLVVLGGLDGIFALSQLLSYSDCLLRPTDRGMDPISMVLWLPDTSPTLLQNWVEIMEWMATNYPFSNEGGNVEASLFATDSNDDSSRCTAVRIRRVNNNKSASPSFARVRDDVEEDTITLRTQAWVKRILVDQSVCPFTKSVKKSGQGLADVGVPVASIAYHASSAIHPVTLLADTFQAIEAMIRAGPSGKMGVSSILLAAPAFDDDFDLWSGPIFAMLEASVVAANAEKQVGVVCFHPKYACPDGSSWPGFGHMHSVTRLEKWYKESLAIENSVSGDSQDCPLSTEEIAAGGAWQRRTPHATINVLRADQLEAAEGKRSSGELYAINIKKLVGTTGIGSDQLARDLDNERRI